VWQWELKQFSRHQWSKRCVYGLDHLHRKFKTGHTSYQRKIYPLQYHRVKDEFWGLEVRIRTTRTYDPGVYSAAVVRFRPVFAQYFSTLERDRGSGSTICPNLRSGQVLVQNGFGPSNLTLFILQMVNTTAIPPIHLLKSSPGVQEALFAVLHHSLDTRYLRFTDSFSTNLSAFICALKSQIGWRLRQTWSEPELD